MPNHVVLKGNVIVDALDHLSRPVNGRRVAPCGARFEEEGAVVPLRDGGAGGDFLAHGSAVLLEDGVENVVGHAGGVGEQHPEGHGLGRFSEKRLAGLRVEAGEEVHGFNFGKDARYVLI